MSWEDLLEQLAVRHDLSFTRRRLPVPCHVVMPDGVSLHVLDWAGAGPPILFLHGGALTAHSWDLVCLALRDDFRCLAFDLRGHGLSGWSNDYSIKRLVADVQSLLEQLCLETCHVVGMSLGGIAAAHYAASGMSRAKTLTVVDIGPWVDFSSTANMRGFMARSIAGLTADRLVDHALEVSAGADRDTLSYRYAHMTRTLPDGTLEWRHDGRRPFDFRHILERLEDMAVIAPQIACPALIVRGGRSRALTDEKAARFAGLFPDGRWMQVPDAGHILQEDDPLALAAAIRRFLASL